MGSLASPAPPITRKNLVAVEEVSAPLLSPDGREFAFTADGQIKFLSIVGGFPVALTSTPVARAD